MATIKDVAKLAGVSSSTASYAINGDKRIQLSTRLKVLEAAKQLNYQKTRFAMDLKRNSTKTISLIIGSESGAYFSTLVQGITETVHANGYDLIMCSTIGGADSTANKFLKERRADGAIVISYSIPDEILIEASKAGIPIILLDRHIEGSDITSISIDNILGGGMATEYLIRKGHNQIGFIGPKVAKSGQLRYYGYQEMLNKYGLKEQSKWVVHVDEFNVNGGMKATRSLLQQADLPMAIVYGNDSMAVGGMKIFKEAGIQVPEQISIIGFDDIDVAGYFSLTTIKQPILEMGALAARLIFKAIAGEPLDPHYTVDIELIERASVQHIHE